MCCTISDKFEKFFRKLFKRDDESSNSSGQKFDPSDPSSQNIFFIKYEQIKKATKNFKPKFLLEGGFGPIYKGWIHEKKLTAVKPSSGIAVAVMRLNIEGSQGHKEWVDEINYLSRIRHPNLLQIIGYSFHQENRIVVYESVCRGSLENHLLPRGGSHVLPWATRIKVVVGTARALAFLHDMEIPVVHGNMKCGDILLDGNFNTKLSGFGLARDGPTGDIATGQLTTRCDVYGFGIVLLELISGFGDIDKTRADWAKPYLSNKAILPSIMDSRLEGKYPLDEAFEVAKIALQCVSAYPRIRPRMAEVVAALEQLSSEM